MHDRKGHSTCAVCRDIVRFYFDWNIYSLRKVQKQKVNLFEHFKLERVTFLPTKKSAEFNSWLENSLVFSKHSIFFLAILINSSRLFREIVKNVLNLFFSNLLTRSHKSAPKKYFFVSKICCWNFFFKKKLFFTKYT